MSAIMPSYQRGRTVGICVADVRLKSHLAGELSAPMGASTSGGLEPILGIYGRKCLNVMVGFVRDAGSTPSGFRKASACSDVPDMLAIGTSAKNSSVR